MDIVLGPAGENVSCNCYYGYQLFTAAKHAWSSVQVGKGTGVFFVCFLFLEMLNFHSIFFAQFIFDLLMIQIAE